MPGGLPVYSMSVRRIVDRLKTITMANGYTFDANVVVPRFADEAIRFGPRDILVEVGRPRPSDEVGGGPDRRYVARNVQVVAYLDAPQDGTEPLHEVHDRMQAELMRALRLHDRQDQIAEKVVWVDSPDDTPVDGPAAIVVLELHDIVEIGDHTKGRA